MPLTNFISIKKYPNTPTSTYMRTYHFRIIYLLSFITLPFLSKTQITGQREKINFDDNWRFAFGNANDPSKDFNYSLVTIFSKTGVAPRTAIDPKFNDSAWRALN